LEGTLCGISLPIWTAAEALVQDPLFDVSREGRIDMAQRAIDLITPNISGRLEDIGYGVRGINSWESAHLLSSVAMAEYTTGTVRLQDTLPEIFEKIAAGLGHGDPTS
jgi:hypothetical protein